MLDRFEDGNGNDDMRQFSSEESADPQQEPQIRENGGLVSELTLAFEKRYESKPRVFFAPGRVNLIGAHLDYNGGSVMPVAIQLGTYVASAASSGETLRIASLDLPQTHELRREKHPGAKSLDWAAYPVGVWLEMDGVPACDLMIAGDLPRKAGLSSSASLCVATALALTSLSGSSSTPETIANLAWRAETRFVGVKCGIMDPFAAALGKAGHALLLECSAEPSYRHLPISAAMELIVLDSKKPRELVTSSFNQRVSECEQALAILRAREPSIISLAQASLDDLHTARIELDGTLGRRARHVVNEVKRITLAAALLEEGDLDGFGRLVSASHESTKTDFEVSCAELDFLVDEICRVDGVYGARLTGAGFGGCVVAVAQAGALEHHEQLSLMKNYEARFGVEPGVLRLELGSAAREIC